MVGDRGFGVIGRLLAAALGLPPLEDRIGFVVPAWAELSTASFAALVPAP